MPDGERISRTSFDENHATLGVAYPGEVMTIDADQPEKGNHVIWCQRYPA